MLIAPFSGEFGMGALGSHSFSTTKCEYTFFFFQSIGGADRNNIIIEWKETSSSEMIRLLKLGLIFILTDEQEITLHWKQVFTEVVLAPGGGDSIRGVQMASEANGAWGQRCERGPQVPHPPMI